MKVAQLIKLLKKMPQDMEVGMSAGDNLEWEVSGWVCSVYHHRKSDFDASEIFEAHSCDPKMFDNNPEEWVTIGC